MQELGKTVGRTSQKNARKVTLVFLAFLLLSSGFALASSVPQSITQVRPITSFVKSFRSGTLYSGNLAKTVLRTTQGLPETIHALTSVSRSALGSIPTDIASNINAVDTIPEITFENTQLTSPLALLPTLEFTAPTTDFFLERKINRDVVMLGTEARTLTVSGAGLTLVKSFVPSSYVPKLFTSKIFDTNNLAALGSSLIGKAPRLASFDVLPVKKMLVAQTEDHHGMVLGASTTADAIALASTKVTLPFFDRISLSLYCALSAKDTPLDVLRCNYDAQAQGVVKSLTTLLTSSENQTTTPSAVTSTTSLTPSTPSFAGSAPVYITRYITQYIEGIAGRDGQNGKDGKDATVSAMMNNVSIPSGFGGYVVPSYASPSTAIGVSTIGYLKDTTIDSPTLNNGTALNLSLTTPTLRSAVFNGLTLFNDSVQFTGNVAVNNFNATSSILSNATVTNSTTTNAYITNLNVGSSTVTDLVATNATTTNLYATTGNFLTASTTNFYAANLSVGTTSANSISLTGNLSVAGTSTLATKTVTGFGFENATSTSLFSTLLSATIGFFTDLTTTNATTTNLVATNATTTNGVVTNLYSTNAVLQNATTTFFAAVNASTTNATTSYAYISNLVAGSSTLTD
ncbi:MAG: hypothetical protein ACAH17_02215, partial [Candidatus Paceibacterota bacterium]